MMILSQEYYNELCDEVQQDLNRQAEKMKKIQGLLTVAQQKSIGKSEQQFEQAAALALVLHDNITEVSRQIDELPHMEQL